MVEFFWPFPVRDIDTILARVTSTKFAELEEELQAPSDQQISETDQQELDHGNNSTSTSTTERVSGTTAKIRRTRSIVFILISLYINVYVKDPISIVNVYVCIVEIL